MSQVPDQPAPKPEIPADQQGMFSINNENLSIWNTFYMTDAQFARQADKGSYKFTTVDATYQKWRGTALWGPYGQRWGLRDMKVEYIKEPDGRISEAILHATFYYPGQDGQEASFEIINDWPWRRAAETLKKLHTNTLIKALHYLGFSADVWFGRFEDDPYRQEQTGLAVSAKSDDMIEKVRHAPADKLEEWYKTASEKRGVNRFYFGKLKEAYDARTLEINADVFGSSDDAELGATDAEQDDRY
jgi:hypothetical protein